MEIHPDNVVKIELISINNSKDASEATAEQERKSQLRDRSNERVNPVQIVCTDSDLKFYFE